MIVKSVCIDVSLRFRAWLSSAVLDFEGIEILLLIFFWSGLSHEFSKTASKEHASGFTRHHQLD